MIFFKKSFYIIIHMKKVNYLEKKCPGVGSDLKLQRNGNAYVTHFYSGSVYGALENQMHST